MTRRLPLLERLVIAEPCTAEWTEMTGSERVRVCDDCDKPVFDIARMTRAAAFDFVTRFAGRACIRLTRDAAGRVVTSREPGALEQPESDLPCFHAPIAPRPRARTTRPRTALDLIHLRRALVRAAIAVGAVRVVLAPAA